MDGFTFWFVEELKVKTNGENIWYFLNTRSVGKVIMEERFSSSPARTQAQNNPQNCREMPGRIFEDGFHEREGGTIV